MIDTAFDELYQLIVSRISIISDNTLLKCIEDAKDLIGKRDPKDIPYLAALLCSEIENIWSQDKIFDIDSIQSVNTTDLYKRFLA